MLGLAKEGYDSEEAFATLVTRHVAK